MTRQRLLSVASYFGVFVLGAVTGASVIHAKARNKDATILDERGEGRNRLYVWSLEKKLGLNVEQGDRIEAILEARDDERDGITAPVEPRLKELKQRSRDQIRAVLNESQRRDYDAIVRRYDDSRTKHGK